MTRDKIKEEVSRMPEEQLSELYEFIKYLHYKEEQQRSGIENMYASEVVLAKDWNLPEEDEEWKDL